MIELNNVDLICIDTKNITEALMALNKSCESIVFKNIKLFTNDYYSISKYKNLNNQNFTISKIEEIKSKVDYSKFCLIDLNDYIDNDFCLTVQHDGFIACPELWENEFLAYDYIGAPWPESWGYKNRVGNGGFCLKSKKFLSVCAKIFQNYKFWSNRDKEDITDNEDFLTSVTYYDLLKSNGINFAPIHVACRFSIEHPIQEMNEKAFGFHDKFTEFSRIKAKEVYNGSVL